MTSDVIDLESDLASRLQLSVRIVVLICKSAL
jgi:hypothetical protein